MLDNFSHKMPWETTPDGTDWQENDVYVGDEGFYDDDGQFVPKEDIEKWVDDNYGIVEFEKSRY